MISLPVVRSFLKNDVINMVTYCIDRSYMEGNEIIYMALENNEPKIIYVIVLQLNHEVTTGYKQILSLRNIAK